MTTYIAITIGPIYKTMQQAKRTREAWQASYFFSYIMKCIVAQAKTKGNIILPAENDETQFHGAGIFPDRLIMKTENEIDVDKDIIQKALSKVSTDLSINKNVLDKYLNIHFIQIEEGKLDNFEMRNDKNELIVSRIHKLNYLLNVKELNQTYASSDVTFFKDLFDDKTRKAFYDIAFDDKGYKFDSIFRITAQGNEKVQKLVETYINANDIDKTIFEEPDLENNLLKHQKYIAILLADGDNFGKVISTIGNDDAKIKKFSKDLVAFSQKASNIIHAFGGTIIYIGGDDILAFCPLKNNAQNIFQVVQKLNEAFHNHFSDVTYKENKVSLSYGLSITYYKYPLNEALDNAYDLLMHKAKKETLKNCIAFQLLQNSGSFKETILNFEKDKNFDSFLQMLNTLKEKDQLLQSLTHQLVEDETLLIACLKENKIDGYFDNHYHPEKKKTEVKEFITAMQNNLKSNYDIFIETNKELKKTGKEEIKDIEQKTLQQMNTIARAINFLNTTL